jgi:Na+-driven multidrug efflux pump
MGALLLQNFIRPFVNSGLARTVNPETALAAYQVAYSTAWILVGISFSIHQLVLVFVEDKESFDKVKRFVIGVGVLASSILVLASVTPAGEWLLLNVIGTDPDITGAALTTMLPMAFIPLVVTYSEVFAGVLMMEKRTPVLTMSKAANLIVVMILSLGVVSIYPQLGALLAGISMLLGYVGEFAVVYFFGRKIVPNGSRQKRMKKA